MNEKVKEFLKRFDEFCIRIPFVKSSKIPTEAEMIYQETEKVKESAKKKGILLDDVMLKGIVFLSVGERKLGWSFMLSGGDFPPESHGNILKKRANEFCAFIMAEKGYVSKWQAWADPKIIRMAEELYNLYVNLTKS